MISQGTGLLTDQINLVLILIVSCVSQPTGRQLVFIISQGLPPLAAGDRLKRRDRGSEWQPPVWALSCQSARQHFLAPLPGIEFFCPWRFNDIHLLISHYSFIFLIPHLSWQIQYFGIFSSHISNISSVLFLVWVATPFSHFFFPRQEAFLISAYWYPFRS